jgi:cell division septum initiation protein DivIVA
LQFNLDKLTRQLEQGAQDHQQCKEMLKRCKADLHAQTELASSRLKTITDMKASCMLPEQAAQLKGMVEESTRQNVGLQARVHSLSDDLLHACAERDRALRRTNARDIQQAARECQHAMQSMLEMIQDLEQHLFGVRSLWAELLCICVGLYK